MIRRRVAHFKFLKKNKFKFSEDPLFSFFGVGSVFTFDSGEKQAKLHKDFFFGFLPISPKEKVAVQVRSISFCFDSVPGHEMYLNGLTKQSISKQHVLNCYPSFIWASKILYTYCKCHKLTISWTYIHITMKCYVIILYTEVQCGTKHSKEEKFKLVFVDIAVKQHFIPKSTKKVVKSYAGCKLIKKSYRFVFALKHKCCSCLSSSSQFFRILQLLLSVFHCMDFCMAPWNLLVQRQFKHPSPFTEQLVVCLILQYIF